MFPVFLYLKKLIDYPEQDFILCQLCHLPDCNREHQKETHYLKFHQTHLKHRKYWCRIKKKSSYNQLFAVWLIFTVR